MDNLLVKSTFHTVLHLREGRGTVIRSSQERKALLPFIQTSLRADQAYRFLRVRLTLGIFNYSPYLRGFDKVLTLLCLTNHLFILLRITEMQLYLYSRQELVGSYVIATDLY